MKLVAFSAKNYRSISTAYRLPLKDYTVIVGPNNEGKSNILRGLGLSLTLLTSGRNPRYFRNARVLSIGAKAVDRFFYDWDRDFPINLQTSLPDGKSEFICEFELTQQEYKEFKQKTGVNLSTNLRAKIIIGRNGEKFDFIMKGKGKLSLNSKRDEIIKFINNKILLGYIPAIRTSEIAINIVERLLARELSTLEDDQDFKDAVKAIKKLQLPIIKKIARNLKGSISSFVPDVKNITIKHRDNVGSLLSSSCSVYVDDGIETDLKFKGDGVISLTAISLLQNYSSDASKEKGLVLLLEEPESHLHPKAIHNLKKVISDISNNNQVILTTHSPIIVDRGKIEHNIIIEKGKATPANNIQQVRESLGIIMSDNLSSAYLVLLVEGTEDIQVLQSWLNSKSPMIKNAIEQGIFTIDSLGGGTNVGYKASLYKSMLCNIIVFVDNDEAGRKGVQDAIKKGILATNEYILSSCQGMTNSELEDLIEINCYRNLVYDTYGVDLNIPKFKSSRSQWSNRVKDVFQLHGKIWTDQLESEIKYLVNQEAAKMKLASLNSYKSASIDSLVITIEKVLSKLSE